MLFISIGTRHAQPVAHSGPSSRQLCECKHLWVGSNRLCTLQKKGASISKKKKEEEDEERTNRLLGLYIWSAQKREAAGKH